MTTKKPQDLLEFFRRSSEQGGPTPMIPAEPGAPLDPTPRMLVLRYSQVAVGAIAAFLTVVLAFILGLALGGDGEAAPADAGGKVGVWTIRVISYDDTDRGRKLAKSCQTQLIRKGLGDEVSLRTDRANGKVVVHAGAWFKHPDGDPRAKGLLKTIQEIRDHKQRQPFQSADYWLVTR